MDPITLALAALQGGGTLMSIFGKKKRKSIDPEWLKQKFGAGAVNDELMALFNRAINSTQGQQLMTNAAQGGQQFQTDLARGAANAGLGAAGGASTGADIFAAAGAGQAVNNLQRGMKASLMESMLPVAQQMVQGRLAAFMQGEGLRANAPYEDSPISDLGGQISKYASIGMAGKGMGQTAQEVPTPTAINVPQGPLPGGQPAGPNAALGAPSMASIQGSSGARPSRFLSKMSRFSGMSGAVRPGRFAAAYA